MDSAEYFECNLCFKELLATDLFVDCCGVTYCDSCVVDYLHVEGNAFQCQICHRFNELPAGFLDQRKQATSLTAAPAVTMQPAATSVVNMPPAAAPVVTMPPAAAPVVNMLPAATPVVTMPPAAAPVVTMPSAATAAAPRMVRPIPSYLLRPGIPMRSIWPSKKFTPNLAAARPIAKDALVADDGDNEDERAPGEATIMPASATAARDDSARDGHVNLPANESKVEVAGEVDGDKEDTEFRAKVKAGKMSKRHSIRQVGPAAKIARAIDTDDDIDSDEDIVEYDQRALAAPASSVNKVKAATSGKQGVSRSELCATLPGDKCHAQAAGPSKNACSASATRPSNNSLSYDMGQFSRAQSFLFGDELQEGVAELRAVPPTGPQINIVPIIENINPRAKVLIIGGDHISEIVHEDQKQTLRQMTDVSIAACHIVNGTLTDIEHLADDDKTLFQDKDIIVISAGGHDLAKPEQIESSVLAAMQHTVNKVRSISLFSAIIVLYLLPRSATGTSKGVATYNDEVRRINKMMKILFEDRYRIGVGELRRAIEVSNLREDGIKLSYGSLPVYIGYVKNCIEQGKQLLGL